MLSNGSITAFLNLATIKLPLLLSPPGRELRESAEYSSSDEPADGDANDDDGGPGVSLFASPAESEEDSEEEGLVVARKGGKREGVPLLSSAGGNKGNWADSFTEREAFVGEEGASTSSISILSAVLLLLLPLCKASAPPFAIAGMSYKNWV